MAIDAGIYNQLKYPDPNGLSGMLDTYQQGKEHQVDRKNKLAELAQEQQLRGFKIDAAKRAEAAIPQQQADAQRQREAEYMRGVSRDISNNPQNADALLQKYAQDAPQQGVNPEHITWLAQDLSTAKDPAELADKAYFHSLDEKQQAEYQSKKRLQSSGADEVFKEVEGSDGKLYGITKSGKTIPLAVGVQQISGKVAPIDYNKPFNADGSPNLAFQRYQQSLKPQKDDNTKPPAGYRFTANGDLQAIPGGPADIKASSKLNPQQIEQASLSAQQAIDQAAKIFAHPGKGAGTGLTSPLGRIPGTDAYGFQANLDTFKAQTFLPLVQALKGMGALSDAEGKKIMDSVGALKAGMKTSEFDSNLIESTQFLFNKAKAAGLNVTLPPFANQQAAQPTGNPQPLPSRNQRGWVLHTDAQGNKAYVSPDGSQYEEAH